ncbi:MAG: signal peptidase I [Treponema sp.]|jgi:signal peptidase I|nr:signal peptidase I [Treponema sp.]
MKNTVTERGTGRAILAAFSIALMIKLFIFDFVITEGQSMLPAIQPGTVLMVDRRYYGLRFPWSERYLFFWAMPKKGDVVIFYTPMGDIAVKRCAGITAGDKFIALGDNSLQSYDSRSYGPIPIHNIIGKVLGN